MMKPVIKYNEQKVVVWAVSGFGEELEVSYSFLISDGSFSPTHNIRVWENDFYETFLHTNEVVNINWESN